MACFSPNAGPPASRTEVKPRRSVSRAVVADRMCRNPTSAAFATWSGVAAKIECQCASIRPGMSVFPWASMTVALSVWSCGGPIASIVPLRTSTWAGSPIVAVLLLKTRTSRRTVAASFDSTPHPFLDSPLRTPYRPVGKQQRGVALQPAGGVEDAERVQRDQLARLLGASPLDDIAAA